MAQASGPQVAQPACLFVSCARPDIAESCSFSTAYADVGWSQTEWQLPLVYHERYNIGFFGVEKLHPFDSHKFEKVVKALGAAGLVQLAPQSQLVAPQEATREILSDIHTAEYLDAMHSSAVKIAQVTELAPLVMLPVALLKRNVVSPMKLHVAGTMAATGLAIKHGWAINIGGGMHHAYSSNGMGWCPFDDIMLAVRRVRAASNGAIKRVLYIDLDVHQGNGVERDKLLLNDDEMFIVDVYNARVFPNDYEAKKAIDVAVELKTDVTDTEYLPKLRFALDEAREAFPEPDLIFYNAGTDILVNDPLGHLCVSEAGVHQRDEMVWQLALDMKCPIVMTLSGGYAADSAGCVSRSLINLFEKFGLDGSVPPPPGGADSGKRGWKRVFSNK